MPKSLDGLHPTLMRPRVEALLADPEAVELGIFIVSAFRSDAYQERLWRDAVAKYGSEAAARKWVAPPGKSKHGPRVDGFGTAVDLGLPGTKAVSGQWPAALERKVNALAARHGLYSPMDWEDWHFEPIKNWTSPEDFTMDAEAEAAFAALNGKYDVLAQAMAHLAEQVEIIRHSVAGYATKNVNGKIVRDAEKRSATGRIEIAVTKKDG